MSHAAWKPPPDQELLPATAHTVRGSFSRRDSVYREMGEASHQELKYHDHDKL